MKTTKAKIKTIKNRVIISFITLVGYIFIILIFLLFVLTNYKSMAHYSYIKVWIILLLFLIMLVYLNYKYIYLPFKKTSRAIRIFNLSNRVDDLYNIALPISNEIVEMTDRIKSLTEIQYKIKESKKQAEYLALQSQINPHFLYNTLEAIRGDALSVGMHGIAEITEALATFFRYTISISENLVTVEDELINIENYFIIQKYRFGDRLNYSLQYNNECLEYKLPKMTLQPIIENAIYHGIEKKYGQGNIRISIEITRTMLLINLIDDGVGIEEDKLFELNQRINDSLNTQFESNKNKGGIALINVNNRIRLLFGELYGLKITSTLDIGTDVQITLPLVK